MYIKAVRVENYKGVESIQLTAGEAALILVGGDNDAGKTSFLDALLYGVGGSKAVPAERRERPIRDGEDAATIELVIDGEGPDYPITVTRRITKTERLEVVNASGHSLHSPQGVLDKLYSTVAIDPLEFESAKTDRRDLLLRALGIGEALDALEAERAKAYTQRRDVNRDLKRARQVAAERASRVPPAPAPAPGRVDVAALRARVDAARAQNAAAERAQVVAEGKLAQARQAADAVDREVAQLRRQLQEAEARQAAARKAAEAAQAAVPKATLLDTFDDEMALDEADARNAEHDRLTMAARTHAEAKRLAEEAAREAADLEQRSATLTAAIQDADARKRAAVASVPLPVPGLGVEEDQYDPETGALTRKGQVLLDGVPFGQASSSRRLRASFAVAVALRPELKVAICRHGERLGGAAIEELTGIARESGFQFWVERVGTLDPKSIVIEAGRVKA